jgi:hypothetical protein
MQLEEKQIPYTIEKINMRCYGDKPGSFLAKVRPAWLVLARQHGCRAAYCCALHTALGSAAVCAVQYVPCSMLPCR